MLPTAVGRWGRRVVDQDLALDGRALPSGEVRRLEARIKDLG